MFVGRKAELRELNSLYDSGKFECVAVYGRRHIGKTSLISEFIKDKDAIYFSARELTDKYNLEAFKRAIAEHFGIADSTASTWSDAMKDIGVRLNDERLILVMDNYSDACLTNKELSSIIAKAIDENFIDSRLFLILCCGHMTAFDREVLDVRSPLSGYVTCRLNLKGLSFEEASEFMAGFEEKVRRRLYDCIGGTPLYLSNIDGRKTADENIADLFLRSSGFLYNDIEMALQKELIGPAVYNSILRAIAYGNHKSKDILSDTGEERSKLHKYLNVLIAMDVLCRDVPEGEDPSVSRRGMYYFEDNAYRFWYRYVLDNRDLIARGYDPYRIEGWQTE